MLPPTPLPRVPGHSQAVPDGGAGDPVARVAGTCTRLDFVKKEKAAENAKHLARPSRHPLCYWLPGSRRRAGTDRLRQDSLGKRDGDAWRLSGGCRAWRASLRKRLGRDGGRRRARDHFPRQYADLTRSQQQDPADTVRLPAGRQTVRLYPQARLWNAGMHFWPDGKACAGCNVDRDARFHRRRARDTIPRSGGKMRMIMRGMALLLLLALTGCGLPANVVVLIPDENGAVGKVVVAENGSTAQLNKALAAVNAGSAASLHNVFTAERSQVDDEFAGALAATPRAPIVHILYFQSGSTELDPMSRGNRCGKGHPPRRYQRCRSCRRHGRGCLQPGAVSQPRRDRARRAGYSRRTN